MLFMYVFLYTSNANFQEEKKIVCQTVGAEFYCGILGYTVKLKLLLQRYLYFSKIELLTTKAQKPKEVELKLSIRTIGKS